jgi:hypothetical protein
MVVVNLIGVPSLRTTRDDSRKMFKEALVPLGHVDVGP